MELAERVSTVVGLVTRLFSGKGFTEKLRTLAAVGQVDLAQLTPGFVGDDPARWPAQLVNYMRLSSPETFAVAERMGRVDFSANAAAHWGEQYWREIAVDDSSRRESLKNSMRYIAGRVFAGSVGELALDPAAVARRMTPLRYVDRANETPVLSFLEFEELNNHHKAQSTAAAREVIATEVISAIMREPSFARLLEHPIFHNSSMAHEELYLQALGALRFGVGDSRGAARAFEECLRLYPGDLNALCLFNSYRADGRTEEGFPILERAIENSPGPIGLKRTYAAAKFGVGDVRRANEVFDEIRDEYIQQNKAHLDKIRQWNDKLQAAIASGQKFPTVEKDVYTEAFALSTWWNYWYHFNRYSRFQHPEGILDKIVPEYVADFLAEHKVNLRQLIEVGTMCAEPLYRMAKQFSDCQFVGVDRQPILKKNNDLAYDAPNTRFIADDIQRFLEADRESVRTPAMLLHVRTSPFFYPAGLLEMYKQAAAANVEYIALLEHYGFSYVEARFLDFDLMQTDGEARAEYLTHHNYRRTLDRAGYDIVQMKITGTYSLFTSDGNALFLVAKKRDTGA